MEKKFANGRILALMQGDITQVPSDAICNAANSGLHGGGGVDGAIHRTGGPSIMAELDIIRAQSGGCPPGQAVATGAGELPAKYVFHAVGPIYRDGRRGEADTLASAYDSCMKLAAERGVHVITFPSISTGVYGYPLDEAAPIALRTIAGHLETGDTPVEKAIFVLFDSKTLTAYERALSAL